VENFKVLWTDANGHRKVSVVSYDRPSAEDRKRQLEPEMSDVVIVPVFPPNWDPEVEQPKPKGRVVQRKHTAAK
jgi:hypothetical protein